MSRITKQVIQSMASESSGSSSCNVHLAAMAGRTCYVRYSLSPLWVCLTASLNVHIFKGSVKPPATPGSFGESQHQVVGPQRLCLKGTSLSICFGVALSDSQAKEHLRAKDKTPLCPFTVLALRSVSQDFPQKCIFPLHFYRLLVGGALGL